MNICLNCLKNFEPNANENTVKLSEDKSTCDSCGKLENLVTEFDDYSKEYNNAIDAVNSVLKDYFDFVPLNKAIAITDALAEKGLIKLNKLQSNILTPADRLKLENANLRDMLYDSEGVNLVDYWYQQCQIAENGCRNFEEENQNLRQKIMQLNEVIVKGDFSSITALRARDSWFRQNTEYIDKLNEYIAMLKERLDQMYKQGSTDAD